MSNPEENELPTQPTVPQFPTDRVELTLIETPQFPADRIERGETSEQISKED